MIRFVAYSYGIGAAPMERWCDEHELSVLEEDWEEHLMTEHRSVVEIVRDLFTTPWVGDDPNPEYSRLDRLDGLGRENQNVGIPAPRDSEGSER